MRLLGVVFAGGKSTRMGRPKALLPWPRSGGGEGPLILRAAEFLHTVCASVEVAAGAQWREILPALANQNAHGTGSKSTEGAAKEPASDPLRDPLRDTPQESPGQLAGTPGGTSTGRSLEALSAIEDAEIGVGPLGGLVAALERSASLGLDGTLILACDMPLVEEIDVRPLIDEVAAGADAALWTVDGYDQPLCAVYGPRAAEAARLALARKARRPVAIFDQMVADGRPLGVKRLVPSENSRVRLMNVNTPSDYDLAIRRFHECQGRSASSPSGPDRR